MIHNRKVVALLPIKENSERVPGKNFRPFCNKPLYHHILHTLDKTYAVDEIVIDTDSERVMYEAPKLSGKVKVFERPEEICGDMVSMNKVLAHDLSLVEADIYLQTHATNPLLKAETVANTLKAFLEAEEREKCDSLFTVTAYKSRFYFEDGTAVNHDPEDLLRTQDLPDLYEENSCIYVFTRDSFAKRTRRIGEYPKLHAIPRIESIDIDDEFTFRLAEVLALYAMADDGD